MVIINEPAPLDLARRNRAMLEAAYVCLLAAAALLLLSQKSYYTFHLALLTCIVTTVVAVAAVLARRAVRMRDVAAVTLVFLWPLHVLNGLLQGARGSYLSSFAIVPQSSAIRAVPTAMLWLAAFMGSMLVGWKIARDRPYRHLSRFITPPTLVRSQSLQVFGAVLVLLFAVVNVGPASQSTVISSDSSLPGLLAVLLIPIPAAWWRRGWRVSALILTAFVVFPNVITANVAGVVAPIFMLGFANGPTGASVKASTSSALRAAVLILPAAILAVFVAWGPLHQPEKIATFTNYDNPIESVLTDLRSSSVISDTLLGTIARPDLLPSPISMLIRVIESPFPRFLLPSKSVSYDVELRQRMYPRVRGAVPGSLLATAGAAGGVGLVIVAGIALGAASKRAVGLLSSKRHADRLAASLVVLLILDIVRVGGGARELQTFILLGLSAACAQALWGRRPTFHD